MLISQKLQEKIDKEKIIKEYREKNDEMLLLQNDNIKISTNTNNNLNEKTKKTQISSILHIIIKKK